ncbi:RUS1 [Symbiodinium pilosum]|uniref:RUS1 protein n=1 Tax=Symbiodinium pilosum TaxID=2952 RepID=A0A812Q6T4_SYMPI|nr:RUS1 [Symbiodinium pilosum]
MSDLSPWAPFAITQGHLQGQRERRSTIQADGEGAFFLQPSKKPDSQDRGHQLGCHPLGRLRRFVNQVFMPVDFPSSVTESYLTFIQYTACQLLCSHMSKIIATQAMLLALGVGGPETIPMAAVTAWVLKDGIGHLLAIVVGTLINRRFDSDPKRFRFQAMMMAKSADLLCILTLQWPGCFFALSALGGALGRLSMNTGQASRPKVLDTFARAGNLGDIMRCNNAQTTAAELLGTGLGACWGLLLGTEVRLLISGSALLSLASLICCYQATTVVKMSSLNRQRAELVLMAAVKQICKLQQQGADLDPRQQSVIIPSPEEIRHREVFVLLYSSPGDIEVNPAVTTSYQLLTLPDPTSKYLLGCSRGRLAIWYHVEAAAHEVLQGFFHSQLLLVLAEASGKDDGTNGDFVKASALAADLAQQWWASVYGALLSQGWQTDMVFLDARNKRVRIDKKTPV